MFSTIDSQIVLALNHLALTNDLTKFVVVFCSNGLIAIVVSVAIMYFLFNFPLSAGQRVRPIIGYAAVSILLAMAAGYIIETFIGRARPFALLSDISVIGSIPKNTSMPSLHTLAAFAFAGAFIFWRPKVNHAWWLIAAATLVGLSRIAAGLHYPTDVLVGAAIGITCAYLVVYEGSPVFRWLSRGQQR
ncbi:MAG: phosphatase PAP2 family protein [Patescibacteria group bacterium]